MEEKAQAKKLLESVGSAEEVCFILPTKTDKCYLVLLFPFKQKIRKLQTEVDDAHRKVVVANAATRRIEEAYAALKKEVSISHV